MPRLVYIGRPSLNFYGKNIAAIATNLKNFGVGRILLKETEALKYKEPCYYKLTKVEPFMCDEKVYRCRVWGQKIYRGEDLGNVLITNDYESDWKLVPKSEENELVTRRWDPVCKREIKCVATYPPLLAAALIKQFPNKFSKQKPPLLLMKPHETELDTFDVLSELTEEEKSQLWPPLDENHPDCRIISKTLNKTKYHIRRSDTPGIYWKVELEKNTKSLS